MSRDVIDLVEPYLSEDPGRWAKLASDVRWRRLQLLLLRGILVELRKLNHASLRRGTAETSEGEEPPCES